MAHRSLDQLRNDPRPLSAEEAARILNLTPGQLAALDMPVTRVVDGVEIYDSWDVVHWLEVQRDDPARFEARIAGYSG